MLKTLKLELKISRASYKPQEIRKELEIFLVQKLCDSQWVSRLQMVASELIANSCEHRFDDDSVVMSLSMTCYRTYVRVQIVLEDNSNLLIMQRYNNLADAVERNKTGKRGFRGPVHGRGLDIILNWTDKVDFSKKRAGGLKIKAIKTVIL